MLPAGVLGEPFACQCAREIFPSGNLHKWAGLIPYDSPPVKSLYSSPNTLRIVSEVEIVEISGRMFMARWNEDPATPSNSMMRNGIAKTSRHTVDASGRRQKPQPA